MKLLLFIILLGSFVNKTPEYRTAKYGYIELKKHPILGYPVYIKYTDQFNRVHLIAK